MEQLKQQLTDHVKGIDAAAERNKSSIHHGNWDIAKSIALLALVLIEQNAEKSEV